MASVSVSGVCEAEFQTMRSRLGSPEAYGRVVDGTIHADLEWHANGMVVSVPITVELGPLETAPDAVKIATIPIEIHAAERERLFPTFSGTVEAVGGVTHTQVALVGRYRPPAGVLGLAIDATVLHGIAEAALIRYLHSIVTRMEQAPALQPAVPEVQSPG